MEIQVDNLAKELSFQSIFSGLSYHFLPSCTYGIQGGNGSGKSTFMQVLSSYQYPSSGKCQYFYRKEQVTLSDLHNHFTFAAPYIQLIDNYSVEEYFDFFLGIKGTLPGVDLKDALEVAELQHHANKKIRFLSSGMIQRVKLTSCILANVSLVFLDEPTTNLDHRAKLWFQELLKTYSKDRTLLIASNDPSDLEQCNEFLNIEDYKN